MLVNSIRECMKSVFVAFFFVIFIFRDLEQMSQVTGASPIFLDATTDFNTEGGPVGGQTRISLRNEHLSYIFTWYSLCGITSFMWYRQFLRRI